MKSDHYERLKVMIMQLYYCVGVSLRWISFYLW